jgi:hypothetical protein
MTTTSASADLPTPQTYTGGASGGGLFGADGAVSPAGGLR